MAEHLREKIREFTNDNNLVLWNCTILQEHKPHLR
jgi:hypothetical protein